MKKIIAKNIQNIEEASADCLVVFSPQLKKLSPILKTLDTQLDKAISNAVKEEEWASSIGSSLLLNTPTQAYKRLLLISLGNTKNIEAVQWTTALSTMSRVLKNKALTSIVVETSMVEINNTEVPAIGFACLSLIKANYHFQASLGKKRQTPSSLNHVKEICFAVNSNSEKNSAQKIIKQHLATAHGINTARELGNLPANYCTPTFLANEAKKLAKNSSKITCKILNEKMMRELKMNSLLSVSAGSQQEAKLIQLEYKGAATSKKPIVLVGKGITFDSGGISLKPGSGMDEMKFDMCGAASVMGVFNALAKNNIKLNVTGLIAASENMPSGMSTKPGDVITSMSGQTIEVLNTDAEGRLVLCDTLTYAQKFHKPKLIIDLATLTGACIVALGYHAAALYSNDDSLAQDLLNAGTQVHDRMWRMPLWSDYTKQLKSNFADLANIGGPAAGSVTAACFLQSFIEKDMTWAHLDIAGIAWNKGAAKGASGRPVAMLMQYLQSQV